MVEIYKKIRTTLLAWGEAATHGRDPFQLAGLLLLLILPLHILERPLDRMFFAVLLVPGILFPAILLSLGFWMILSTIMLLLFVFFGLVYPVPNHMYLITYAMLLFTIFISLRANMSDRVLFYGYFSKGAGLIIGLCFFLATLGKLFSPDFMNGSFFVHVLLTDGRFDLFRSFLTALSESQTKENMLQYQSLLKTSDPAQIALLSAPPLVYLIAHFFTWWTVLAEAAIALLFLLSVRYNVSLLANAALILFIVTTYSLAPVPGFAGILISLGYMYSIDRGKIGGISLLYLLLFVLTPLVNAPAALSV